MSAIYSWFYPNPVYNEIEDDPLFYVLQNTEFGGLTSTACLLLTDIAGNCYLHPQQYPEMRFPESLPSSEGWPASSTLVEEYLQAIDSFKGLNEIRPSSYVSELLNDLALNIPHQWLVVNDANNCTHALLGQVVSDIRRRSAFYINGMLVFRAKPLFPSPIPENSIEENAKHTFESCVRILGGDVPLANNAMKVTTQATFAHLCILMHYYFTNTSLYWQMSCQNQIVNINTLDPFLTTITYKTSWMLKHLVESPSPPKFLSADVQIIIETDSLRQGKGGDAIFRERISPFFPSESLASQFILSTAGSPSSARSLESYFQAMDNVGWAEEEIPPLIAKTLIKRNRNLKTRSDLDLYGDFRKLRSLTVGGIDLLAKIESKIPIERRASLLIQALDNHINEKGDFAKNLIAIALIGAFEHMFITFKERYENVDFSYLLQGEDRAVDIKINPDNIVLTLNSIWALNDMSLAEPNVKYYFKGTVQMNLPKQAIVEGDIFPVTAQQYTSPFYKTKKEAEQADHLAGTFHALEMLKA